MYRLALEMKIWDVERWSRQISVVQLRYWLAYYRIEPFGQTWRRTGRLVTMLVAALTGRMKTELEDQFLPTYRDTDRVMSEQEMIAELQKSPLFRKANENG